MFKRVVLFAALTAMLSGCFGGGGQGAKPSPGASVAPVASPSPTAGTEPDASKEPGATASAKPPSPAPAVDEKESVSIVLDSEPRLRSPIGTVVPPTTQTFTVVFKEAMDRKSVEKSLLDFNMPDPQTPLPKDPLSFKFDWKNDKELKLTVTPALLDGKKEPVTRHYRIYFKGAQTLSKKVLQDPPGFGATIHMPIQLWRVSVDGTKREKLTDWKDSFAYAPVLGHNPRYAIVQRFMQYCECDADHERMMKLYDLQEKKLTSYSQEIATTYQGPGEFIADRRGFFYSLPEAGANYPGGSEAVKMKVDGYIWGASWSKDGKHVIMAVSSSKDQTKDLDLVFWNSDTDAQTRKKGLLKGGVPLSDLDGSMLPVEFKDDGAFLYTTLLDSEPYKAMRYRYEWKSGKLSEWKLPFPDENWWVDFLDSGDGQYRLYSNGQLFKNEKLVDDKAPHAYSLHNSWLKGTHKLAVIEYDQKDPKKPYNYLALYDADTRKRDRIIERLPDGTNLVGVSSDGKWIYLQTSEQLPAK